MKKLSPNNKIKGNYSGILVNEFRELVKTKIGQLDTATSFMYLYRRFGQPDNSDQREILYDYRFRHEDLVLTIHASYHEFVMFNIHIPQRRFSKWFKQKSDAIKSIYKKYQDGSPFMPYGTIPWEGLQGLTKAENKKNLKLIDAAAEKYFSKEDNQFLEENLGKQNENSYKAMQMLMPFEQTICENFRAKLTKLELDIFNNYIPKIEDIDGLKKQCLGIIDELKKGCYIRDVAINISGYDGNGNIIKKIVD